MRSSIVIDEEGESLFAVCAPGGKFSGIYSRDARNIRSCEVNLLCVPRRQICGYFPCGALTALCQDFGRIPS